MKITDGELYRINVKLRELAIKESKHKITEGEYQKQAEPLKARAYELTQSFIKQERIDMYPKKEPEKKTVETKLNKWW